MKTDLLLEKLEKFGLNRKELSILKILSTKSLNADEICKKTGIPKGRIYAFLNNLLKKKLIKKSKEKKSIYSAIDLKQRIITFLEEKHKELIEKETRLSSYFDEESLENIKIVKNEEDYFKELTSLTKEEETMRILRRGKMFPFFFFPADTETYLKMRVMLKHDFDLTPRRIEAYLSEKKYWEEAFDRNFKFHSVVSAEAIKHYFQSIKKLGGQSLEKRMIKQIFNRIENQFSNVRVAETVFNYNLYVTQKKVFFALSTKGVVNGIVIKSSKAADVYSKIFTTIFSQAEPLEKYLKKYLKKRGS